MEHELEFCKLGQKTQILAANGHHKDDVYDDEVGLSPSAFHQHPDSALPSDTSCYGDAHSSEEELEVINGGNSDNTTSSNGMLNKRKWSQANPAGSQRTLSVESSGSSDEEVQGLIQSGRADGTPTKDRGICTRSSVRHEHPVEFRTSPPVDAHKPTNNKQQNRIILQQPIQQHISRHSRHVKHQYDDGKVQSSPRKRLRHSRSPSPSAASCNGATSNNNNSSSTTRAPPVHHIQRPCLDFEKMQQLKARAVTTWRHGGELSLFCW